MRVSKLLPSHEMNLLSETDMVTIGYAIFFTEHREIS